MKTQGQKWFAGLKRFVGECRSNRPIVARETLPAIEEMQCRIIGGSLMTWLQDYGPRLIQERAMHAKLEGWEKDPFVVFTSEQPGLVAAREIIGEGPPIIAFLYPTEFTEWLTAHPDPEYHWHVHTWSFFATVDDESAKKTRGYPVGPGESLWLHKEGARCGQLFGRGGDHLWKWTGRSLELLEEGLNQWVS
jgi:hypothetical protein